MKILYVHAKGEIGGSDISLLTILKNINRKQFSPNVIVGKKGPFFTDYKKYSDRCEEVEFTVLKSPENLFDLLRVLIGFLPSIFMIWNVIRKWDIDVVHVNTVVIPSAVIAGKLAGKPVIVHKREIITSNKFASGILDFITYIFANKVIAISNGVKKSSFKPLQNKTIVIYNGVNLSEIKISSDGNFRKHNKISKDTFLIGIFSRIEPWKGQHIVIKSIHPILSKFNNVKLMIFGNHYTKKGERYFEYLKSLVKDLELGNHVVFPGWIKNLNEVYSEFDLVVLPSIDPEPLGRVVIEAMAAGKPVLATNLGGSKECIVNNESGLLVKENDVSSMGNAILKILENKSLRNKFGHNGRERVETFFDIENIITRIEKIYKTFE